MDERGTNRAINVAWVCIDGTITLYSSFFAITAMVLEKPQVYLTPDAINTLVEFAAS